MADTRRSLSALQTLLADNTSGDISPQDLRDMLATLTAPYGGVALNGNTTATTISVASTDYVTNWATSGVETNVREFTTTTGGRLTYTGTPDTHVHVVAQIGAYVTINASKDIEFKVYKNGTTELPGALRLTTQGNTEYESTAVHTDVMMSANDYLELWCSNETDTNDITLYQAYIFAMGMMM